MVWNKDKEKEKEVNSQRPKFSVSMTDSFVESILDLKEWLKSPWEEL